MGYDHDRLMLVRAELSDQLETLRLTSFQASPVQFLTRLDSMRKTALQHEFGVVAQITSAFETAMQDVLDGCGAADIVENFMSTLEDAIGCSQLENDAAQAMLAALALRLRG